jgi:hypothetical protein
MRTLAISLAMVPFFVILASCQNEKAASSTQSSTTSASPSASPEKLKLTLRAPDGKTVDVDAPKGCSDFADENISRYLEATRNALLQTCGPAGCAISVKKEKSCFGFGMAFSAKAQMNSCAGKISSKLDGLLPKSSIESKNFGQNESEPPPQFLTDDSGTQCDVNVKPDNVPAVQFGSCDVSSSGSAGTTPDDMVSTGNSADKSINQTNLSLQASAVLSFRNEQSNTSILSGDVDSYMLSSGLWHVAYGMGKLRALQCALLTSKKTGVAASDVKQAIESTEDSTCRGLIAQIISKFNLSGTANAGNTSGGMDTGALAGMLCFKISPPAPKE